MTENVEINDLYAHNLKIYQNSDYFKVSLDSFLLADFVNVKSCKHRIIDLCSGNAPIPLLLSKKTTSIIYGVEIQNEIFELAKKSVEINNLTHDIVLLNVDVKELVNMFDSDSFNIVTCNPPYFKVNENSNVNDNSVKAIARHEIKITFDEIVKVAKKLLKRNGDFYFIHRTERLFEIINILKKNKFEPKVIRFVYPKAGSESNMVLVKAKKRGNPGLKLMYPLVIHNDDGTYKEEVLKMFGVKNDTEELL